MGIVWFPWKNVALMSSLLWYSCDKCYWQWHHNVLWMDKDPKLTIKVTIWVVSGQGTAAKTNKQQQEEKHRINFTLLIIWDKKVLDKNL